jgi:hypothetical protein
MRRATRHSTKVVDDDDTGSDLDELVIGMIAAVVRRCGGS